MPIIDAHVHVFPPDMIRDRDAYCQRDRWFATLYTDPRARLATADELLLSMQKARIDQAVVFCFAFADMGLCRQGNDYVLQVAQDHPERLIPFAEVNPVAGADALREARRCFEGGARGLGELAPEGQGFELSSFERLTPLMALADAASAPVLVHVNELVGHEYAGKGSQGLREAYALAKRYPGNKLILAHWGGGLPFFELMPEVRATLRNVYYDTSASPYLYDAAIYGHVAGWAAEKILFGSDYPLLGQSRVLAQIRESGLPPESLLKLLGDNLRRLLQL